MIGNAETALEAFSPQEVNSWASEELNIVLHRPRDKEDDWRPWEPRTIAFTPETFLLSYSIPNFHFHAVTAYDILRSRGVPLGKRDYEGWLRTRSD